MPERDGLFLHEELLLLALHDDKGTIAPTAWITMGMGGATGRLVRSNVIAVPSAPCCKPPGHRAP